MATVKVTLRTSVKYKDGTSPVMLRVRANGKVSEVQLFRIQEKHWIEEKERVRLSAPLSGELNELIHTKRYAAEKAIVDHEKQGRFIVPEKILTTEVVSNSVFEFLDSFVKGKYEQGYVHSSWKYESNVNVFKQFLSDQDVNFNEVDLELIQKFITYERKRGISDNTTHRRIKFFRSVFEAARKQSLVPANVFDLVDVKKVKTKKERLTKHEISLIENAQLGEKQIHYVRCAFLMQYYLRGARISDVLMLKPGNIRAGRVEYVSLKTGAIQSVAIHEKLKTLLHDLLERKFQYLLPFMKFAYDQKTPREENEERLWSEIESRTAKINSLLKDICKLVGIEKKVTTHVARHTFARMVDAVEPDKRKVAAMLGHSKFSMTEEYLESLRDDELDESTENVFNK